jgi:hypothetical protein
LQTYLRIGIVILLVVIAGCGGKGPYRTTKISGTITYDDGSIIPAERIEIKFISQEPPLDGKTHPKIGLAEVNEADGSFNEVSTYEFADGLIQGKHKVAVMSLDAMNLPTDAIPEPFRSPDTSNLTVDSAQIPFKLVIPKPKKK